MNRTPTSRPPRVQAAFAPWRYLPYSLVAREGLEPSIVAYEATVLPLHHLALFYWWEPLDSN